MLSNHSRVGVDDASDYIEDCLINCGQDPDEWDLDEAGCRLRDYAMTRRIDSYEDVEADVLNDILSEPGILK